MKIGMRKPSIKKSLKARTTGKLKRSIKRAIIPGYGKKGMGWVKNPKRALYNKIYRKTSFSVGDLFKRKKDLKIDRMPCRIIETARKTPAGHSRPRVHH